MRGVVDNRVTLIVRGVFYARLEGYRAPVEATKFEIEVFVNGTCIDQLVCYLAPRIFVFLEEVTVGFRFNAFHEFVNEGVIAADGNTLVQIVEIVVVKDKTERQTTDDKGR